MKYWVSIGESEYLLEVLGDAVRYDGRTLPAELRRVPGTPLYHLTLDGRAYPLAAAAGGEGSWRILHRGEEIAAEVLDERRRHLRQLAGTARTHRGAGQIKAPMPGLVVRILAAEGQQVGAGDGLVVLEAMKMENELKASGPGVVGRVVVAPGDTVERGAVLVELLPGAN